MSDDDEVPYEDSDQRLGGHDQPYEDEPEGAGEDCFENALWNANPQVIHHGWEN